MYNNSSTQFYSLMSYDLFTKPETDCQTSEFFISNAHL